MPRCLALALAIAVPGCRTDRDAAPAASPTAAAAATISGQIFIAQRDQNVVKLSLVDVYALPENDLSLFTAAADASRTAIQVSFGEARQAMGAVASHTRRLQVAHDAWETGSSRAERSENEARWTAIGAEGPELKRRLVAKDAAFVKACAQSAFPDFGQLHPVAKAASDADGKFRLSGLRAGASYLIAAAAHREIPGRRERYYWLLRVVAGPEELQLNNRNLVTVIDQPLVKIATCESS